MVTEEAQQLAAEHCNMQLIEGTSAYVILWDRSFILFQFF
jgi:hypothetical protein